MEKGIQLKCIICGVAVSSVYNYHKHNVRQHTHVQLSRAILKLQQLQLPLNDPATDDEDEEEEEERKRLELDMAEVLDLPIKCELMDEEVIELGPTENADHLQVQSRLVKNPNDNKEQSRQVIEVQENHPPPACYINPTIEDPDAIVVKFNRELVMALDSAQPTVYTPFTNQKKQPNRNLRATFKSSIEIPDPSAFAKDYKRPSSHSHDKYIMQNVILMENPPKRRRGRPRKVDKPQPGQSNKFMGKFDEVMEDEDLDVLADPVLFSDNEDEEATAAMPNITRSRSGRLIKTKVQDGTFSYYDIPGQEILDTEELNRQLEWKGDPTPGKQRGKYRRKRKLPVNRGVMEQDTVTSTISATSKVSSEMVVNNENVEVEVSEVEEGISMPLITDQIDDETTTSVVVSSKSDKVTAESFECLFDSKSFSIKEEHLGKLITKSEDISSSSNNDIKENMLFNAYMQTSCIDGKLLDNPNIETMVLKEERLVSSMNENVAISDKEVVENQGSAPSNTIIVNNDTQILCNENQESQVAANSNEESQTCNVCHVTFTSASEFQKHSHESAQECHICKKKYQSRINLQTHIKKYHEETEWMKFVCALCGENFGFLLALERHMKEHNPNQKFCCEQCGKVFKNLSNLKNHIPLHTKDEVYECPYCPKLYYIRYSYEKHLKTHECTPKYRCEICGRKFIEKKQFELHLERHQISGSHGRSEDYKCNNCGDIKTQSDLDLVGITDVGHHKTCVICGKGLYKKYRYIVENLDIRPFQTTREERIREQCKWCGKFVLNLTRHIRNTHLENEYVSCDLCGLVVTKASLPSHKNRKHGGSKVTCDHCNQTFKNVMCLREHMAKVRRKQDPSKNVCKFCKEIVSPENWKEHMTKHKSKCNDCGAAHFSTHEEFLAHLDSCRRCSNCNLSTFGSREEYLSHIEICSSGIDVITSSLDSTSEQEVVTSIFAIVDGNTCETCGIMCPDGETLAQHLANAHPETLTTEHMFSDGAMINEAILYACPKDSCGDIFTSKELLSSHLSIKHGIISESGVEDHSGEASDPTTIELGDRRYLYAPTSFKTLL